ncbi:hypothetical protein MN608_11870 [Microdochium nivale]|nr:hypothetical protein MN608_11870 [Microdochium nivale]
MHLSALPLALAALALSTATSAIELHINITTGGVLVPVVFAYVSADNGDYYPFGYFVDGCKARDNLKQICIDGSRHRAHVVWDTGRKQCLSRTKVDSVTDGRNRYEYQTYTEVACTW